MLSSPKGWILLFVVVGLCAGCVGPSAQEIVWQNPDFDLVWPDPPDPSRISYLRSLTGPADFEKNDKTTSAWNWLLGEKKDELPLLAPYAVAAADGIVWVADSGARMLYRIDLAYQKIDYLREFSGQLLTLPSGVAVDAERDRVFLADAALSHILVLDLQGKLLDRWAPAGGFQRPAGMAISPAGELFVCDATAGKVVVFNNQGQVVSEIHSQVAENGRFVRPLAVAIGPSGNVAVLDALAFRVEVQDRQGQLLSAFGQTGDAAGSFARPKGLTIDAGGHIYVSDAAFDNIQVFDMAGKLLMYLGKNGTGPGQFNLPAGLFVDAQQRLFAADSYNHRVQVFQLLSGVD